MTWRVAPGDPGMVLPGLGGMLEEGFQDCETLNLGANPSKTEIPSEGSVKARLGLS